MQPPARAKDAGGDTCTALSDARAASMALIRSDIVQLLGTLPAGAFGTDKNAIRARAQTRASTAGMSPLAAARKADWVLFVAEANAAEGDASPPPALMLCTTVARLMAEAIGAVRPIDYSDAAMRDMLIAALKPGAKPFTGDSSAEWRDFAIKPCHINMALRAQSRAMEAFGRKAPAPVAHEDAGRRTAWRQEGQQSAPAEAAAKPAEEATRIAAAMEEYVKASKELLEEKREKPLAFAMEARRVFRTRGQNCSGRRASAGPRARGLARQFPP